MQNRKLLVTLKSTLKWLMLQLFLINEAQMHSYITRAFKNSQNKLTVLLLKVYPTILHRFKNARSVTNLMLSRNILLNQTPKVSEMTLTMETMSKSKNTSYRVTSERESLQYREKKKKQTTFLEWIKKEVKKGMKEASGPDRVYPAGACAHFVLLSLSVLLSSCSFEQTGSLNSFP